MPISVDVEGLVALLEDRAREMRDAAGVMVLESVKADCPVSTNDATHQKSGAGRDSIIFLESPPDQSPIFSVSIGSEEAINGRPNYLSYTDEDNADDHFIVALNAPLLKFWWDPPDPPASDHGAGIFAFVYVHHPGTTGQRWFASKNEQRWMDALEQVVG